MCLLFVVYSCGLRLQEAVPRVQQFANSAADDEMDTHAGGKPDGKSSAARGRGMGRGNGRGRGRGRPATAASADKSKKSPKAKAKAKSQAKSGSNCKVAAKGNAEAKAKAKSKGKKAPEAADSQTNKDPATPQKSNTTLPHERDSDCSKPAAKKRLAGKQAVEPCPETASKKPDTACPKPPSAKPANAAQNKRPAPSDPKSSEKNGQEEEGRCTA